MKTANLTRQQWLMAHFLAGNLADMNVSKNLVLGLRDYLSHHHNSDPNDYLKRLVDLGDAFAGGQDELSQRRELRDIMRHATVGVSDMNWPLVLSWTARLMVAYRPEERRRPKAGAEAQIEARIRQELAQNLKRLEAPYYG